MTTNRLVQVPKIVVAKYYLQSELGRVHKLTTGDYGFMPSLDNLSERAIMELFEGLSIYYRLNSVYWAVANPSVSWTLQVLKPEEVFLTGIGLNNLTDLIYSDKINNNPVVFKKYLSEYFSSHSNDDPQGLNELRPSYTADLPNDKLMLVQMNGKLKMLDGSHRFIEQLLRGVDEFTAYVGKPANNCELEQPISGAGVFRMLKRVYLTASNEAERDAVITVSKQIAKISPCSKEFIQETWLQESKHSTKDVSAVGRKILDDLN